MIIEKKEQGLERQQETQRLMWSPALSLNWLNIRKFICGSPPGFYKHLDLQFSGYPEAKPRGFRK